MQVGPTQPALPVAPADKGQETQSAIEKAKAQAALEKALAAEKAAKAPLTPKPPLHPTIEDKIQISLTLLKLRQLP